VRANGKRQEESCLNGSVIKVSVKRLEVERCSNSYAVKSGVEASSE